MKDRIQERKNKLQAEIKIAETILLRNIHNVRIQKYFPPHSSLLMEGAEYILKEPHKSIETFDMVSRSVLPKSNIIRKVLRYLNVLLKIVENFPVKSQKI